MTDAFQAATGAIAPEANPSLIDSAAAVAAETTAGMAAAAPEAVAQPAPEAAPLPEAFARLGLAPQLLAAVRDLGYSEPTEVQSQAIPRAMGEPGAGFVDLMVSSQTGSGKTAAFLLPVLHTLIQQQAEADEAARAEYQRQVEEAAARGEAPPKKARRRHPADSRHFKPATPGALILCPTRELAQQVAHDAIGLVAHCRGLRIASVVGGMPYQLQIARLQNANLVVATPGRLLDLQRSMQIKLDQVQFLVVDEADRMLDLGFADDLAEINQLTSARRQTMMFSATFAPRIQQLAARVMREPQKIQIATPQQKHENIRQALFWADNSSHKRELLDHWLRDPAIEQAIVFASTQVECDGLANDLQQAGFSAVALHGALSQGLRNRRLMALRNGQVQILVATDVAARGIDVPSITHVFNFGLPMKAEDYTHRIGRTGRAGRDGLALTFAEARDARRVFDIEEFTRQPFKTETIPGLEPTQRMPRREFSGRGGRGGNHHRGGRDGHGHRNFGGDRGFGGGDRNFGSGDRGFGGGDRGAPQQRFGQGGGKPGVQQDRRGGGFGGGGFGGGYAAGPREHGHGAREHGHRDHGHREYGAREGAGSYGRKAGWGEGAPRGGKPAGGERRGGFAGAAREPQRRAFKPSR